MSHSETSGGGIDARDLADLFVSVLNRALEKDPGAVNELIRSRVPCNETLASDPLVDGGPPVLGLLGVVNGVLAELSPRYYLAADMERPQSGEVTLDTVGPILQFSRLDPVGDSA